MSTLPLRRRDGVMWCQVATEPASAPSRPGFFAVPTATLEGEPDEATVRRAAIQVLARPPEKDTGTVPAGLEATSLEDGTLRDIPVHDAGTWPDSSGSTPAIRFFLSEGDDGPWERITSLLERWSTGEVLLDPRTRRVLTDLASANGDFANIATALRAASDTTDPTIEPWMPGIRILPLRTPTLPPATHTNCIVAGTVAIDPASPYPEEQDRLDAWLDDIFSDGRALSMVLLTHDHADHFADARRLADRWNVPVGAHSRTAELLPAGTVDQVIADGQYIPAGTTAGGAPVELTAFHTPGHARGHLCYLEPRTGTLVAGDMVAGIGTILIDPSDGDMAQYLASLERLRALGTRVMIPAHGEPIGEPDARLIAYREHRLGREEKVAAALRQARTGATAEELVPFAYDDTPEFLHPLAQRSLVSHLRKLSDDGRCRIDGDRYEWVAP